jgi:hypothetical protein
MAKNLLDGPQIRTTFEKVCRGRMSEGMRAQPFSIAQTLGRFVNDIANYSLIDSLTSGTNKERVLALVR